jgi:isocitrate dehydrogenase kinase/phosphatase
MTATPRLSDSRLANVGANAIHLAFDLLQREFDAITARAPERFGRRDWHGGARDAAERIDLYDRCVRPAVEQVTAALAERARDRALWPGLKAVYSGLIAGRDDWEIAETFFNSVTRRIFTTVGVESSIEFVDTDFESPPTAPGRAIHLSLDRAPTAAALFERILAGVDPGAPYEDLARDAARAGARLDAELRRRPGALRAVTHAEVLLGVFYRGQGAYIVGRLFSGAQTVPLVLALAHGPGGAYVDAVLLDEDDVSVLFSFTRSYFHVRTPRPYDLVHFLKTLMPRKRLAELYIAVGFHKHGKTELYRDLLSHLATTDDRFEVAPGARGMVMGVFVLPAYDMVFKVIKDRFDEPKNTTREAVMGKYRLVFRHDRAGRLIDAQEFEWLRFDRRRFSPELLDELLRIASKTVSLDGDTVVVRHAYAERRVIPLDIFVREADEDAARRAVEDYGQALKDLAASNIFPGDVLPKNFGVTRHGRVVCYDYDELVLLEECNFRDIPRSSRDEDEWQGEPWYYVGPGDIFPEEFRTFLGLPPPYARQFSQVHGDLFGPAFWKGMQAQHAAGGLVSVLPYPADRRLDPARAD